MNMKPVRVNIKVVATSVRRTAHYAFLGLRMVLQVAPRYTAGLFLCGIILGVAPVISLLIQRAFVNHFADLLRSGETGSVWTTSVIVLFIGFLLTSVSSEAAESFNIFCMTGIRDRVEGFAKSRIFGRLARAKTLDIFEDPGQLNALNLAYGGIPRLQQIGQQIGQCVHGVFSLVPVLLLTASIAWWIPLLLAGTILPAMVGQIHTEASVWDSERILAEDSRRLTLIEQTLTRPAYAKDVRLFGLSTLLVGRWQTLFDRNFRRVNVVRTRGMRVSILWSLFSGVGVGVSLVYVVDGVATGHLSPGDLVLAIGAIVEARRSFAILSYAATQLSGMTYSIEHFHRFMDAPDSPGERDPIQTPQARMLSLKRDVQPLQDAITIEHLAFSYRGSGAPSIAELSLRIKCGTTVAIVGENGAGKSTFAKLIGRLYTPTEGTIRWDDIDIQTFDIDAYRDRLAFMTQDIAEFPFSLRDNLAFGRLNDEPSDEELGEVLRLVGLDDVESRSDDALEIPITRELEGGTQLSGGQWQRLAMARVMLRMRQADVLIMDEPTAAFDPTTEHQMIEQILALSRGKTAIIITHRLALCTQVDEIVVFHEGRVVERGTHRELITVGGRYARMFANQSQRYQSIV